MIYILYSNDLEVNLKANYKSEKEVLIENSSKLLSAFEEMSVPLTIFADVAFLWRYREAGYGNLVDFVEAHLVKAYEKGNDVQVHIHPHWSDTKILKDMPGFDSFYEYDYNKFHLGAYPHESREELYSIIYNLLLRSKKYLTDLFDHNSKPYKCVSFRAGCYGLQPHTDIVFSALENAGFLIDSSVIPGMIEDRVDFTNAPDAGNYYSSEWLKNDYNGISNGIYEIPIAALSGLHWQVIRYFCLRVKNIMENYARNRNIPNGISLDNKESTTMDYLNKIYRSLCRISRGWFSLELNNDYEGMFNLSDRYIKKYYKKNSDLFFSFSCHSCGITADLTSSLIKYHKKLTDKFHGEINAITFQEAAELLEMKKIKNLAV